MSNRDLGRLKRTAREKADYDKTMDLKLESYKKDSDAQMLLAVKSGSEQKIAYKGENLLPYLPAGMAFQEMKEGLHYRFRIVVENKSYMLDGIYSYEEALVTLIVGTINRYPSWTSDSRIVFYSDRPALGINDNEIYIMDYDGSNPVSLTDNTADDRNPCVSPLY